MAFENAILGNGHDFDPAAVTESLLRQAVPEIPANSPIDIRDVNTRILRKIGQPSPNQATEPVAAPKAPLDFSDQASPPPSNEVDPSLDFSSQAVSPPTAAEPAPTVTVGGRAKTFGKGLAHAAIEGTGGVIKGLGQASSPDTMSTAVQTAAAGFDPANKWTLPGERPNPEAPNPGNPMRDSLIASGKATQKFAQTVAPMSDQEKASMEGRVGMGVGGILPYIAAGAVNPVLGLVAGGVGMAAQSYGDTYDDAIKKGASDEDAAKAAGYSGLVGGALGVVPIGVVLTPVKKFAPALTGWAAGVLDKYVSSPAFRKTAASAGTMAAVVEAQEYLGDQIAQHFYEPKYRDKMAADKAELQAKIDRVRSDPALAAQNVGWLKEAEAGVKSYDDAIETSKRGYSPEIKRVIASLITGGILGLGHHAYERWQDGKKPADQPNATAPADATQPAAEARKKSEGGLPPPEPDFTDVGGDDGGPSTAGAWQRAREEKAKRGANPWDKDTGAETGSSGPQPGPDTGGPGNGKTGPEAEPGKPPPGTGEGKGQDFTMDAKTRSKMERVYRHFEPGADPSKMSDADLYNAVNEHLRDTSSTGYTAKAETAEEATAREQAATERTERDALKRRGWTDAHIDAMTPEQRRKYFQDAMAGKQATPPKEAPEEPTAAAGTRDEPIKPKSADDVLKAQPVEPKSPAQAEAENFKHAHLELEHLGLTGKHSISVETGVGQERHSKNVDAEGKPEWSVKMEHAAYGRIKGTRGADGQPLDIFVGPHPTSPHVFVLDQHHPGGKGFDEHKILAGFRTPIDALHAYANSYTDGGGDRIGHVTAMGPAEFQDWLKNGDHSKQLGPQKQAEPPRAAIAKPRAGSDQPLSLLQFIASKGGLAPHPELNALDLAGDHRVQIPGRKGFFGLIRPTGDSLDMIREAAEEAGYLKGENDKTSTVRDLLDAIDNELRGQRKHADGEELTTSRRERKLAAERERHERERDEADYGEARATLIDSGYQGLPTDLHEAAVRLMVHDGMDPDSAVERAALRLVAEDSDYNVTENNFRDIFGPEGWDEISNPEDSNGSAKNRGSARDVQNSRVPNLGSNSLPLQQPGESSGSQLHTSRHNNGAGMEGLSGISGARREAADAEAFTGQDRQRQGVRSGERAVGNAQGASPQSTQEREHNNQRSNPNDGGLGGRNRAEQVKDSVSDREGDGSRRGGADSEAERTRANNSNIRSEGNAVSPARSSENGEPSAREREEEPGPRESEEASGHGERVPAAGQEISEATEAGEQRVIPGAEKIGQGELAQRKADERLKPAVAQKAADIGLFGDEMDQTDLLDLTRQATNKIEDLLGPVADNIRQVDIARAAEKLAENPDMPPAVAFSQAVAEGSVGPGLATQEQAEEIYGPEIKEVLQPVSARAPENGAPVEPEAAADAAPAKAHRVPEGGGEGIERAPEGRVEAADQSGDQADDAAGANVDTGRPAGDQAADRNAVADRTAAGDADRANWLKSLSPEIKERVLAAMREVRKASDDILEKAYKLAPRNGERAVGGQHADQFAQGESLAKLLSEIGKGKDIPTAAEAAKEAGRKIGETYLKKNLGSVGVARDMVSAIVDRYAGVIERAATPAKTKIEDFGEKIGGARKDTTVSTGERGKVEKPADDRPTWAKRFEVIESPKTGKWTLFDKRTDKQVRDPRTRWTTMEFDSKDQAEAMIPLVAVAQKHRVISATNAATGTKEYRIIRDVTDKKRVTIKDGFETSEEATKYLHDHAKEILDTKTGFGEEILATPEKVMRKGEPHREGDVRDRDFSDTFGFRGVEFGNWNNQAERQEVMNHAFDALSDLAALLNVPPKALSLDGELAIAFGARGQGLSGARAHYERDYGTINLTKMSGAGTLAHEWMHAFDHYLARLDSKAKGRITNAEGHQVFDAGGPGTDYITHGAGYKSKLRDELKAALKNVTDTIETKAENYVEDTQNADKWLGTAKERLAKQLNDFRRNLAEEQQYGAKKKPANVEQLARFDALADKLRNGDDIATSWKTFPVKNSRLGVKGRWTNDTVEALSALYKEVRGRTGFTDNGGPMADLVHRVQDFQKRAKMMEDAAAQSVKTKRVPTQFVRDAYNLDQGRASDYWGTPHELAARALSSYVEDKIAEQGGRSDFLSYGSDNAFYRIFNQRPFPEGAERQAINAAFDNLFKTIKAVPGKLGPDTALASVATPEIRSHGVPEEAANVIAPHVSDQAIKSHPDYQAAKAGDIASALRLVESNITPDVIRQAKERFGDDAIYAPVIAEEQSGHNAIPMAMAEYLADRVGGSTATKIKQTNRAFHTGAKAMERLAARAQFGGPVERGGKYVLVDDVSVMGSTIADLANHIQRNGGNVAGVITLANAGRNGVMRASKASADKIERRFGNEVRELFHLDPSSLTADEAAYLLNFRDADALRTRRLTAERERTERLGSKGIVEAPERGGGIDQNQEAAKPAAPKKGGGSDSGSLARLTTRAALQQSEIEHTVRAIVRHLVGDHVKLELTDGLMPLPSDASAAWGNMPNTGARGLYFPWQHLIRLAMIRGASSTAFHESYHAIEYQLQTPQERRLMERETPRLRDYVARSRPGYSREQVRDLSPEEVRAIAFEDYATARSKNEPDPGKGMHTGIRRWFQRLWDALRKLINDLRGLGFKSYEDIFEKAYRGDYAKASGETPRAEAKGQGPALASIHTPGEGSHGNTFKRDGSFDSSIEDVLGRRLLGRLSDLNLTEAQTQLQDKFARVKNAEDSVNAPSSLSAYQAESLYYGRTGHRLEQLTEHHIDPIIREMKARDIDVAGIDKFLYARHAPERNNNLGTAYPAGHDFHDAMRDHSKVGGSGMSTGEALKIIRTIKAEGKLSDYITVAKMVDALNAKTRRTLFDAGLISRDTYDGLNTGYKYYVPLRGWAEGSEHAESIARGSGMGIKGKEFKQAFGRQSEAASPLAYSIMQAELAIVRAEKNKVGNTFLKFVRANPDPSRWTIDKGESVKRIDPETGLVTEVPNNLSLQADNVFSTKVDGKTVNITLKGPDGLNLARALKNMGTANVHALIRAYSTLTHTMAKLATSFNPDFMIPNFARDMGEAFINLQAQEQKNFVRNFLKHVPGAMRGAMLALAGKTPEPGTKMARYVEAFHRFDEAGGRIRFFGIDDPDQIERNAVRKLKRLDSTPLNTLKDIGDKAGKALEIAGGGIENATRLAAFMAAEDAGIPTADAAMLARNLTVDFNKKGELGGVISSLYMFANAGIQGQARMIKALGHRRVWQAVGALAGAAALSTLYSILTGGEDEAGVPNYMKIPAWERDKNLIFMTSGGYYVKVPLPYGFAPFAVTGARAMAVMLGYEKPLNAASAIVDSVKQAFNPLGEESSMWMDVVPSAIRPAFHILFNKNWTGKPLYPDQDRARGQKPDSTQSFKNDSAFSKEAAKQLNSWSGGNSYQPGAIDVHPGSIDHTLQALGGGVGRFVKSIADTAYTAIKGDEWQPEKTPILRRFVGKVGEEADRAAYYEKRQEVRDREAAVAQAKKDRAAGVNVDEAKEFLDQASKETRQKAIFNNAEKQMKILRKQEQEIANSAQPYEIKRDALTIVRQNMRKVQNDARAASSRLNAPAQ